MKCTQFETCSPRLSRTRLGERWLDAVMDDMQVICWQPGRTADAGDGPGNANQAVREISVSKTRADGEIDATCGHAQGNFEAHTSDSRGCQGVGVIRV